MQYMTIDIDNYQTLMDSGNELITIMMVNQYFLAMN